MEILCTRPGCSHPKNNFADLDDTPTLKTVQQKYCTHCGMPLILAHRYLPIKLLGKGGFGAAFQAKDRHRPKMPLCVVKQFQPEGNLNPQELAIAQTLFEREAITLEELGSQHPQIPQLYAFFPLVVANRLTQQEEQFFYLVQEFIDGKDLETELSERGIFSEAKVREVMTEILGVLQFVHQHNCIHRDIKPSNIMRDKQGRLYLLDFGAVKQVTAGAGNQQKRSTGIFSMGFAPPEQMHGSTVYPSTDLYALATTCLNLLTGKNPKDLYNASDNQLNWRPYAPQVSDHLAAILDRLLLPEPINRYSSATEVLKVLNATPSPIAKSTPTTIQQPISPPNPWPPFPPTQLPSAVSTSPRPQRSFSSLELLYCAGFTGFEGALLILALKHVINAPGIVIGCMIIGGLIYLQYRRIIEGKDLLIISIITLLLMLIPWFQGGLHFISLLIIAIIAASGTIAIMSLFRLIYQLLSQIL